MDRIDEKVYTFSEALTNVMLGNKVTRIDWGAEQWYVFMESGLLKIHRPDQTVHNWIIGENDMIGDDYIIVPDDNE